MLADLVDVGAAKTVVLRVAIEEGTPLKERVRLVYSQDGSMHKIRRLHADSSTPGTSEPGENAACSTSR